MVWIFLQYLDRKKSPSFSVSYIKASERHFLLFSSHFVIFRVFKPLNSLPIRLFITSSKRDFKNPQELGSSVRVLIYVSFVLPTPFISSALHSLIHKLRMGRFERLVKTPALIELFKEKYHIPQEVSIRYCSIEGLAFDREMGEVIIPMIAFI